jgi:3-oxoacid CoA-transferase
MKAVFSVDRRKGILTLLELMPGATLADVKAKTGAPFEVADGIA